MVAAYAHLAYILDDAERGGEAEGDRRKPEVVVQRFVHALHDQARRVGRVTQTKRDDVHDVGVTHGKVDFRFPPAKKKIKTKKKTKAE